MIVLTSGLVVECPELEPVLTVHRRRLDPLMALGVPAHITVLAPFLPSEEIDETVLASLRDLFAPVPAFDVTLSRTEWFGTDLLWLAPDDDQPFRALTARAYAAYPSCPPYGGEFPDPIPHLTVGAGADVSSMRAAAQDLQAELPVAMHATHVSLLLFRASGRWACAARFALSDG